MRRVRPKDRDAAPDPMDSKRQRLRKGGSVDDGEAADVFIAGVQSPAAGS